MWIEGSASTGSRGRSVRRARFGERNNRDVRLCLHRGRRMRRAQARSQAAARAAGGSTRSTDHVAIEAQQVLEAALQQHDREIGAAQEAGSADRRVDRVVDDPRWSFERRYGEREHDRCQRAEVEAGGILALARDIAEQALWWALPVALFATRIHSGYDVCFVSVVDLLWVKLVVKVGLGELGGGLAARGGLASGRRVGLGLTPLPAALALVAEAGVVCWRRCSRASKISGRR